MFVFTIIFVVALLGLVIWAFDRHLCLKDVEKDLNIYLGDVLVLRDSTEGSLKVHFSAEVAALKSLIGKHFKL